MHHHRNQPGSVLWNTFYEIKMISQVSEMNKTRLSPVFWYLKFFRIYWKTLGLLIWLQSKVFHNRKFLEDWHKKLYMEIFYILYSMGKFHLSGNPMLWYISVFLFLWIGSINCDFVNEIVLQFHFHSPFRGIVCWYFSFLPKLLHYGHCLNNFFGSNVLVIKLKTYPSYVSSTFFSLSSVRWW